MSSAMDKSEQQIRQHLGDFIPEDLGVSLNQVNGISAFQLSDAAVTATVTLGYPCDSIRDALIDAIHTHMAPVLEQRALSVTVESRIVPHRAQSSLPARDQVANIIAVASDNAIANDDMPFMLDINHIPALVDFIEQFIFSWKS